MNDDYLKLHQRIEEIINHFSFEQDNPTESPSSQQEDYIRAMVLLSHAEFEAYFENMAIKLLEVGKEKWEKEGIANKNIASLFLNSEKFQKNDNGKMETKTYSYKTISVFKNMISGGNHGIKIKNIEKMYEPLGYAMDEFDQSFLSELDSFGVGRGQVAHSAAKTQQILDFKSEKKRIVGILEKIKEFERIIFP